MLALSAPFRNLYTWPNQELSELDLRLSTETSSAQYSAGKAQVPASPRLLVLRIENLRPFVRQYKSHELSSEYLPSIKKLSTLGS